MSEVLIVKPGRNDVAKCMDFMEASDLVEGKRVLIKPNLTVNMPAKTGVTTHPYLVAAAAEYLIDSGADEVLIGESSATRVGPSFRELGFSQIAEELGIGLLDFWEEEAVSVEVPQPLAMKSFRIAKAVLEAQVILNMPVLKIHQGESKVTLCAKNMMGCIWGDKSFMHTDFDSKIIDLLKVVRPTLNIVDGIVGMEGDEINGKAVGANLLVAGKDFVAADSVCSRIMGFVHGEVGHIVKAESYGMGWADPAKITIRGLSLNDVVRRFERSPK